MARSSAAKRAGKTQTASAGGGASASSPGQNKALAVQEAAAGTKSKKAGDKSEQKANTFDKKVEAAVNKCIKDNYLDFSSAELDGKVIDGLTLRQTLRRESPVSVE